MSVLYWVNNEAGLGMLDPEVYEKAAEIVLESAGGSGCKYSCMAVQKASGWTGEYAEAYKQWFAPRKQNGQLASRGGYWDKNIKFAPRAIRSHPFWDRDSNSPKLKQERINALLMMAEIVRQAKKSHS